MNDFWAALAGQPVAFFVPEDRLDTPHKFGGLPTGMEESDVAHCRNCHHPLHLFLEVALRDPELAYPAPPLSRFLVMACHDCGSSFGPTYYRFDEHGVQLLRQSEETPFDEPLPILPELPIRLRELVAPDDFETEDELPQGPMHRVGGEPIWIQDEDVPNCIGCSQPMRYVAQVDSDEELGVMFYDLGVLYAFACPTCLQVATLIQCH